MFSSIRIQNLGPIRSETVALSVTGTTEVSAASQAGKSTVVKALMMATVGTDEDGKPVGPEHIHDGESAAVAEATTARGAVMLRTVDVAGKKTRVFRDVPVATEKVWRNSIGPVGAQVVGDGRSYDVVRLIACPWKWMELLNSSKSRALRDIIAPSNREDTVAAIREAMAEAGYELVVHGVGADPLDVRGAEEHRAGAKRQRDIATGHLEQARRAAAELAERAPQTIDAADLERANDIVERHERWVEHDSLVALHRSAVQARADLEARHERWASGLSDIDARLREASAALKAAPAAPSDDDIAAAKRAEVQAEQAVIAAVNALRAVKEPTLRGEHEDLHAARLAENAATRALEAARAKAAENDGPCPTCGAAGFDWTQEIERLEEALADAQDARLAADTALSEASTLAWAAHNKAREEAEAARDAAQAVHDEAQRTVVELRTLRASRDTLAATVVAIEAEYRRHSANEPPPIPDIGDAPVAPDVERPALDKYAAARATRVQAARNEGAVAEHARQVEAARERVSEAEAKVAEWEATVVRAEALVQAVRGAPARLFAAGVAKMGPLPGVKLVLDDNGITPMVDGRPWSCASHGRRVKADAVIRDGLRRRFGMTWFPLAIDDAQAWTGDFDDIPGPKLVLRTVPGVEGLVVTHEEPAVAGEEAA